MTNTSKQGVEGFTIGDTSKLCDVPRHTIRFWEREFDGFLSPHRTEGKQRRFIERDISILLEIKKLLYTERFTIAGARRLMSNAVYKPLFENVNNDTTSAHYVA